MPTCLGQSSPHPGPGATVELNCGDRCRLLDLVGIGLALASQGIASEEAPPALLEVEPTRLFGNEDMLDPRMLHEPATSLGAIVTREVVGNDKDVACGIGNFDLSKQSDVYFAK